MREFGFELRLCTRLEGDGIVARQLGGGVRAPGARVVDVVQLEPGPEFDDRRAITPATIPPAALDAEVPVGRAVPRRDAFAEMTLPPARERDVVDEAVDAGFFERERRNGTEYVRQVAPYPGDWFDGVRAVENKPDLGSPGDLNRQLRFDVALGLFDEVILATASHVTGAHLNRLPEPVGVWQFRDGELDVIREPDPLSPGDPGVEIHDERPLRTDVTITMPGEKAETRRRIAERAYGKGWRTYDLPDCRKAAVAAANGSTGLPYCAFHDRLVDPAVACGPDCAGYDPGDGPDVDLSEARDAASPWQADPPGYARRQAGLDRFQ